MATVLLATLGESPVVITSMVDKLAEEAEKNLIAPVEIVEILHSEEDCVLSGYLRMVEALQDKYNLDPTTNSLEFLDANSPEYSYAFLRTLDARLKKHQTAGNIVYLSLAGGRKNTSALMALLAPLYPCIKKLYHILNADEDTDAFLTMGEISKCSDANQRKAMFPEREKLTLVDIPYDESQLAPSSYLERLRNLTDEQLDDLWDCDPDEAEAVSFAHNPGLLSLEITLDAAKQYQKLEKNAALARDFLTSFQQMRYISWLSRVAGKNQAGAHGIFPHTWKSKTFTFHFYKRMKAVRPFYHTEPEDIYGRPEGNAQKVIISHLEIEYNYSGKYASGEEIIKSLKFPLETIPLEKIIKKDESILLVPLGATPMIATQLYMLLQAENYHIQRVVLLSPDPAGSNEIDQSCQSVQKAFKARNIPCELISLSGYGDINTTEACKKYQQKLEDTIRELQKRHPSYQIELALAGGRKAMAALAMFAAQNTGIRHLHHTLITDDNLEQLVTEQTNLNALANLHKDTLVNRLFLDAYKDEFDKFITFTVPVIPPRRQAVSCTQPEDRQP